MDHLTLREKEMPEDNEDIWSHILRRRVFSAKNDKAMPPLAGHQVLRFVRRIGPEK